MSVFMTSDLHLGHKLAAEKRGFDNTYDHDCAVIESLLEVCTKRTVLWVLGDVCMDKDLLCLLNQVPGQKKMIFGNHDMYGHEEYLKYFDSVHGFLKYKNMLISHCPIHPQELFRADINVHGHIHKGAATGNLGHPYFNVNWDFWHRPVSLDELKNVRDGGELIYD